jgi:exopolyphosphatase/guanosine-5'-triphosphate,3'-diphosphate pyrophosphatase
MGMRVKFVLRKGDAQVTELKRSVGNGNRFMNRQINSEGLRDSLGVERRAVIDVGSNAVKLLVADVGTMLKPVLRLSLQTGLGRGSFRDRCLRPDAISRTVDAVQQFAVEAVELGSAWTQVLATSAVREAINAQELTQAIRDATGLDVQIISGEQEADYVFKGVTSDPLIGPQPVMVVKVGGGSTEWAVGESGLVYFRKSTPIGTVRLLELQSPGDPPTRIALARLRATVTEFLRAEVSPSLKPVLHSFQQGQVRLVGVGGILRSLAQVSAGSPGSLPCRALLRAELGECLESLWKLSAQERRHLAGLDPEKADLILPEAILYEAVFNEFGFDQMLVSSRGPREGALLLGSARPNKSQRMNHVPARGHFGYERRETVVRRAC